MGNCTCNNLFDDVKVCASCNSDEMKMLPLPVAGLITVKNGE
jgi:hypothetical protein